jgi:hypothetical protein
MGELKPLMWGKVGAFRNAGDLAGRSIGSGRCGIATSMIWASPHRRLTTRAWSSGSNCATG